MRHMHKIDVYRKYILDEMSKDKKYNIKDLEQFVESLNYDQVKQLCKYLSDCRRNSAYKFISKGPDIWEAKKVNISDIYIGEINSSVNSFLKKNDWSLKNISADIDICQHNEFKSQGHIDEKISNFIANKTNHGYRIIDGMHRIIRLCCDCKMKDDMKFKLIYY